MVTRSDKLAMIGPSLADLVLEIFCFAASPSFRGVATLVSKARQAVKDAGSSSPELARDHSDLGKHITDVLTNKVKAARQQRLDLGVDVSLLTQAETAVAALISTDAEQDLVVLSAVRDPADFENYLRTRAAKYRQQIEEQAEPYFDALVQAVAATYVEIAPWSDSFVVVALKSLLGECSDIKEYLNASQIENRQLFSQILQILQSLTEAIEALSKPSHTERVFFGSRPDVVAENRFVKRSEQEHLNALITAPTKQRTVLVGMRGCGKTQLAASLAKQCEDANWNLVAWINAVSRESIQSDLVELAKKLEINTSDQPTPETIIRRCFDQLKSEVPSDRLIIFDNVENIDDLRELVPRGNGLRVVATTTNNMGWSDQGWDTIRVGVFERNKSIDYLLTVTESADRAAADTLADRLGDLPLALAQAAATARNSNLSLTQYLDRLDSYRSERVIRPVPGDYYTEDAATALCMAIEYALENLEDGTKQAARYILGALALLAESGVPTHWLDPMSDEHDEQELQDHDRGVDEVDEDAHDALTELLHKSIVQQSTDKTTTMLHRLQAQTLRESWSKNEYNEACAAAAYLLDHVDINRFRRNDTSARRKETLELTNQLRAISVQEDSQNLLASPQIFRSLSRAFSHTSDLGLPYEALTLNTAVDGVESILGKDHPQTLTSRNNLACAFESAGRLTEAIPLYEQVLADRIRVLGEYHPQTLTSRNNLACAFESAGRLTEAIPLYEQVLADRIRVLGEYHPQTLISRNNLGSAYMSVCRPTDAITLFEQVVVGSIRTMGEDHPDTLMSLNNLAGAYESAGQTDKATVLYEKVLADSIRVLGEDHPHTLATRNNLAGTYISTKNFDDAIILYQQVIADSIRVLGEDHPHTLTTRNNLVYAYASAGQLTEAIMLNERVISDQIRVLGAEHPHTLISRINLAGALETVGRIDEAITQFAQVLTDCIRFLGDNHPSTLTARNNFAHALHTADRTDEAITHFEQFLTDGIQILGDDHPSTLTARNNLASLYHAAGHTDEAIILFEQVLAGCTRVLDEDHPLTKVVRENLEAARRELEQQEGDSANEEREQED